MDLVKEFPGIKNIVKHMVFLVKTIRKTHLIQQLFDKISKEKYGQTLVLILFTRTRWGTICDAAKRLNRVRTAICQLPTEILSNELDIDLAPKLRDVILDAAFWKGLAALEVLFSTICTCLTYLEGNESTLSSVYACFWPSRTTCERCRRMSRPPCKSLSPISTRCNPWSSIACGPSTRRHTPSLSAPTRCSTRCAPT